MSDRDDHWMPVNPGHVIPAGQPYRMERTVPYRGNEDDYEVAQERISRKDKVVETVDTLVDSSWRPPLNLPIEPTWGIVIWQRRLADWTNADIGCWQVDGGTVMRTRRTSFDTRSDVIDTGVILAFIPFADEQVARIKGAR